MNIPLSSTVPEPFGEEQGVSWFLDPRDTARDMDISDPQWSDIFHRDIGTSGTEVSIGWYLAVPHFLSASSAIWDTSSSAVWLYPFQLGRKVIFSATDANADFRCADSGVLTPPQVAIYQEDSELSEPDYRAFYRRRRERLRHLEELEDGWLDGIGRAPTDRALSSARKFLDRFERHSEIFSIFPTESGGVLFEFTGNGWAYSVEFSAGGLAMFYGIEVDGDKEIPPLTRFTALSEPLIVRIAACMEARA